MVEREKKKILLVDDSRTVRQLLNLVLKKHIFCDITEACDGREAVETLGADCFDLLVTDINMPNMNGLSLIRKVRGEMHLTIPIIIVTTMGGEQDRDAGLELGANSYVTKPINGHTLIREATQLLL
jgi:two-component system chemotaxis response regulator CheY